jgi:hypothetical protein
MKNNGKEETVRKRIKSDWLPGRTGDQRQQSLVDVVGKFTPKIVKMDGPSIKPWQKTREVEGE